MSKFDQKDQVTLQKEIYIQTQNWARHNETLIIATNTVLLGAIAAITANYFKASNDYSLNIFWLPLLIAMIGVIATCYLSRQYKLAISRVVVYEDFFEMNVSGSGIGVSVYKVFKRKNKNLFRKSSSNTSEESYMNLIKVCSLCDSQWGDRFVPNYLSKPPKFGAASSWFFLMVHLIIFFGCSYKIFFG